MVKIKLKDSNIKNKVCTKCKIRKPRSEYHKSSHYKHGLSYWCKVCVRADNKSYRERFPARTHNTKLKRIFNINVDFYNKILKSQNGTCAICNRNERQIDSRTGNTRRLAVDHDRKCCPEYRSCGKCIRGLLCTDCNQALGKFSDSIEILESAIRYIKMFSN